jgi:drug/metabolite transporter (DMT)-like permease
VRRTVESGCSLTTIVDRPGSPPPDRRRGQIYVALAAAAWSTAGVLQREVSVDTATQVGFRALFALVALIGYLLVTERGRLVAAIRSTGRAGIAMAFFQALASGLFIVALNDTTVAHVLIILALAPFAAALLGRVVIHEHITGRVWISMMIALAGVVTMFGTPGGRLAFGDLLAVVMTLGYAAVVVITRANRHVSMAPATTLAQVLLVVAFAAFVHPSRIGPHDLLFLVMLGAGQAGLGLMLFTIGARLIPAAEVAIITTLEVALGPLWVWLAVGEQPSVGTLIGGVVVMFAVVFQTLAPDRGGGRVGGGRTQAGASEPATIDAAQPP